MSKSVLFKIIIIIIFISSISTQNNFASIINSDTITTSILGIINHEKNNGNFFFISVPRGVILSVSDDILFIYEENKNLTINPNAYQILDKISEIIQNTNYKCTIEGHSDNSIVSSDWETSIIKSDLICEYIISKHPKLQNKIFSLGLGNSEPFSSEVKTNKNKKLNNRTDFVILEYKLIR